MKPEPSIFEEDEAEDARRYAIALEDIRLGRVIPHEEVRAWLETWGTPDEKPPPEAWFK
jgi:predicted transcriptional regulator